MRTASSVRACRRWLARSLWGGVLVGLALTAFTQSSAQSVSSSVLTSAYLLNFVKFTEWPADVLPAGSPVVLCATDPGVAYALKAASEGRTVGTRTVTVVQVPVNRIPRNCEVLYAGGLDSRSLIQVLDAVHGMSVLSVGDSDEFTRRGGVVHFFIEDGNMRFAINVAAAAAARLQLSSRLLSLARIVKP